MKFLYTSLIALFLLGLCLIEKESKRRALDEQHTGEDLTNSLNAYNNAGEQNSFVDLTEGNFLPVKKHLQEYTVADSTFKSAEYTFLNNKPLLNFSN